MQEFPMTIGLGSLTIMGRMSRRYDCQTSMVAMHMGMRALRNDLQRQGLIVAILAAGMVATNMLQSSGYEGKSLTREESAAALYKTVAALTIQDKGQPINLDGKVIPW